MKKILGLALGLTIIALTPAISSAETYSPRELQTLGKYVAGIANYGDRIEKELGNNWKTVERKLGPIFDKYEKNPDFEKGYNEFMDAIDEAIEAADRGIKFADNLLYSNTLAWVNGFVTGVKLRR